METIERVTVYLLFVCLCIKFCQELHMELEKQRFEEKIKEVVLIVEYENTLSYRPLLRFQESIVNVSKIQDMKKTIKHINEVQSIINKDISGQNTTVLVILVHHNISYLNVFLDSIQQVVGISESLLIFAHDYYDDEINSAIRGIKCARVMQIFYPYSIQLHPNIYPGEDLKFCEELEQCYESRKRDPILAQTKLFAWWVTNQVFDNVGILKKYDGYVYFLETEMYLTSDFIDMAKILEHAQKLFCLECRILSLGARPPRPELYQNNTILKSIWCSTYASAAIGFNRTIWNEIKLYKQQFCHFNDSSWESSLRHLALKTRQKKFLMLSSEGPRVLPTTGCGAFRKETNCTLGGNFLDILNFLPKIREGLHSKNFSLKVDGTCSNDSNVVKARGDFEDARDRELCMFLAHRSSRVYF